MPAVSSVLLKGTGAAGEKHNIYEKWSTTNCLMKLLVVEKEGSDVPFSKESVVVGHKLHIHTKPYCVMTGRE